MVEQLLRWRRIDARFLCPHSKKEVRRYSRHNGSVQVRLQCVACGACLRTLPHRLMAPERIEALPTWDVELGKRHQGARAAAMEREFATEDNGDGGEGWWAGFNAYLASPQWAERRRLVMIRARGVCEGCLKQKATCVHHRSYEHAGDELLYELVALCQGCHRRAHPDDEPVEAA